MDEVCSHLLSDPETLDFIGGKGPGGKCCFVMMNEEIQAKARAALEGMSPQGRLYRPDEVTAAALWLCGPGSEGVNGQAIAISGGET